MDGTTASINSIGRSSTAPMEVQRRILTHSISALAHVAEVEIGALLDGKDIHPCRGLEGVGRGSQCSVASGAHGAGGAVNSPCSPGSVKGVAGGRAGGRAGVMRLLSRSKRSSRQHRHDNLSVVGGVAGVAAGSASVYV